MASEQSDAAYGKPLSRSELTEVAAEPAAVVLRYRTMGFAVVFLGFAAVALAVFLFTSRRQELHCSRTTNTCVATCEGLLHHTRRVIPLGSIVAIERTEKEEPSRHGMRTAGYGIELRTLSGPVQLEVFEYCDGVGSCMETQRVEEAFDIFLSRPEQLRLDVGYGPFAYSSPIRNLLILTCVAWFFTRESLLVVVSPTFEMVAVSHLAWGVWRRQRSFPLVEIERCAIGNRGTSRRRNAHLELVTVAGRGIRLTAGDNFYSRKRLRFAAALNDALDRARSNRRP